MYSGLLAVTNRHLCTRDFLEQIEILAQTDVEGIILREKDLSETEYEKLAIDVLEICKKYEKKCILHTYWQTAKRLGCSRIHLPISILKASVEELKDFTEIGTSVHSVEDAREALECGVTYISAGHIFDTDCKKGLPGRGLSFLRDVCDACDVPVYAIGGITPEHLPLLKSCGAAGGCMMSLSMRINA